MNVTDIVPRHATRRRYDVSSTSSERKKQHFRTKREKKVLCRWHGYPLLNISLMHRKTSCSEHMISPDVGAMKASY